jgi:hypothetical protein
MAAVGTTAAAFGFACSSSSPAPSSSGPAEDAAATPPTSDAAEDAQDAAPAPLPACDAALVLPMNSAAVSACSQCLQTNCMSDLAMCTDCSCISAIECLAANNDNYSMSCPQALSAIGMGNPGLMALAACIPMHCSVCNDETD